MEKLFENKTTYTQDTYITFLKFHAKKNNLPYMAYTIFWSFLLLLCTYLAFASRNRLQGVIVSLILVCFVIYRIYRPKMIVDKEKNSEKISTNNTNTFSFYDKKIEITNNNGTFDYKYFMFRKVYETADFFYLYVTKENAFLVSKKGFSLGTPEEFSKFIKNKCGFKYNRDLKSNV